MMNFSKYTPPHNIFQSRREHFRHTLSLAVQVKLACYTILHIQLASLHGRQPLPHSPSHLWPYTLSVLCQNKMNAFLPLTAELLSLV